MPLNAGIILHDFLLGSFLGSQKSQRKSENAQNESYVKSFLITFLSWAFFFVAKIRQTSLYKMNVLCRLSFWVYPVCVFGNRTVKRTGKRALSFSCRLPRQETGPAWYWWPEHLTQEQICHQTGEMVNMRTISVLNLCIQLSYCHYLMKTTF